MPERADTDGLHDEEIRKQLAIRRGLSAMATEEREMEGAMTAFEEDADQAKRYIEAKWRREHWGHEPEHPLPCTPLTSAIIVAVRLVRS